MKKTILSLTAFAFAIIANTQITVNSTNVISVGDLTIQASDTLIAITPTAASATAQTWDFSTLANHGEDTLIAVDPASTPNGASFPSANLALKGSKFEVDGNFFDAIIYANNSASVFEFVGAAIMGNPADQYDKLIEFPATYNSNFTAIRSTYAKASGNDVGQPAADSVEYISKGTKASTFDAFGTLTTPLGTYSVVRQSNQIITNDTVNVKYSGSWIYGIQTGTDTTYEHQYWTDDAAAKFPIVTYQLNDQGDYSNKSISWLKTFSFASVDEITNSKLSVYPNPANDIINFSFDGAVEAIEITDISGKRIENINKTGLKSINVSNLDNGTYILSVYANNAIYTSKFVKK